MKNEWLTTLLKQKGLSLKPAVLASLLEEISPKARNGALGYVLDWLKPFSAGMGLRVARLGDQHIEVIIPIRDHNVSSPNQIHEAVLFAAGAEALRLLWERHAPLGEFAIFNKKSSLDLRVRPSTEIRLRYELLEPVRESMLTSLRRHRQASGEAVITFFSDKDQLLGELNLNYEIFHTPSLQTTK